MSVPWKAWKTNPRFSTLPTAPWKSLRDSHIPTAQAAGPVASKNRGLLSLMRRHRHNLKPEQQEKLTAYLARHPALELIYRFRQRLAYCC